MNSIGNFSYRTKQHKIDIVLLAHASVCLYMYVPYKVALFKLKKIKSTPIYIYIYPGRGELAYSLVHCIISISHSYFQGCSENGS